MAEQMPLPGLCGPVVRAKGTSSSFEPDWCGHGATAGQRKLAARGLHPTGRALHEDKGLKCRSCSHVARRRFASTYIKCGLDRAYWTGGPGSDIRLKWRACVEYSEAA